MTNETKSISAKKNKEKQYKKRLKLWKTKVNLKLKKKILSRYNMKHK